MKSRRVVFALGVGVSHAPAMNRLGVTRGKPLGDMRQFVADLKEVPRVGEPTANRAGHAAHQDD